MGLLVVVSVTGCGDSTATSTTTGSGGNGGSASTTSPTTTTASSSPTSSTSSSPDTTSSTSSSPNTSSSTSSSSGGAGSGGAPPSDLDCSDPTGTVPALKLTQLTDQCGEAVLAKSAPDDPDRLYVVRKSGQIMIIEGGTLLDTPFLDISDLIVDNGEEGLLGLAFHPDYKSNGRFFVHYSKSGNGDNVVQEFHRSNGDLHVADKTPVAIGLEHPTAEPNHNGGAVEFGPDGFLYVSMGDGGNQNDPECDAQLDSGGEATGGIENLFGKISRIDVDKAATSDGFPAAAGNKSGLKAYHRGLRNPWRISFDACTHDLWVGDVGQNTYEEVDHVTAAAGQQNFGWPYREGAHDFDAPNTCPAKPATVTEPVLDYQHTNGRCAIDGGWVYRSSAIPALRGAYFYGDDCTGEIWYVAQGSSTGVLTTLNGGSNSLSAFGQDGRGNVYTVSLNGKISRIDAE